MCIWSTHTTHITHGIASITLTVLVIPPVLQSFPLQSRLYAWAIFNRPYVWSRRAHTATMCELPMKSNRSTKDPQTLLACPSQIATTIKAFFKLWIYTNRALSTFNLERTTKFEFWNPFEITLLISLLFPSVCVCFCAALRSVVPKSCFCNDAAVICR